MKPKKSNQKQESKTTKEKKPGGIIAFGVIHIILYSLSIISLLISLFIGEFERTAQITGYPLTYLIISSIISLVIGATALTSAISILSLKEWGRKMIRIVAMFIIVYGFINTIYASINLSNMPMSGILIGTTIIVYLIGTAYQGTIIWYFGRKEVKKIFS
ncbi:hypothetical protein K9L67_04545 [Candidatus Woesearchaeota archaeon]|nr:hypothetical protein [Candidatus Woesearchaeota archaeon]MCF7901468.1 hypothetical protein [Candidatus Woesearchaeota archaeon]MCF8013199.1 hypothetical protein [Candidatus Woesearchaeota archaeon]